MTLMNARAAASARLALACAAVCGDACDRLPTGPASSSLRAARGITLADWTPAGYASASAASALAEIAAAGANTVVLVVTAYQTTRASNTVGAHSDRTPEPAAVRVAMDRARASGLRVVLKPHVDVEDGTWRGFVAPSDPQAWFAAYRAFVVPWAAMADSAGATGFVVGTELASTVEHEGLWRDTIRSLRAVFAGELTYAASWDEAERVPFWGAVDAVGIDFYYPVARRADPSRLEILAEWQPWLERLAVLHRRTAKPIRLAEIGYRSVDGAGLRPWDFRRGAALDVQEQADLYWAALQAAASRDWIDGLYWWNWRADGGGGRMDADYTPRGKPAEIELRRAWRR